jgi:ribose transport system ATP-binding protein
MGLMPRRVEDSTGVPRGTPALSVRGVTKTYPGVLALHDVSLEIAPGTVHALVGENGAGKSTLVRIITGASAPDSGALEIGGKRVPHLTPQTAQGLGVSVIHQERQIAFDLSITENVLLGRLPTAVGRVSWSLARRIARERLALLGCDLDLDRPVRSLAVAELQELEIARALSTDIRLLVMDEPTSALSGPDIRRLFDIVGRLRERGVAVLYISHHLEEIFEIASTVTVMRDGTAVTTRPVDGLTTDELVALMLGRRLNRGAAGTAPSQAGAPMFVGRDLERAPSLKGVSLSISPSEILCITGAVGSGRRELARCLAGVDWPDRGEVTLSGRRLRSPRDAIRQGVVFLPEDRKRESLLMDLAVIDNLAIGTIAQRRGPIAPVRRGRRDAHQLVSRLNVKTRSLRTPIRLLSGGNQQKVVLGRWLQVGARVFVFDEPTAGIDVGAKLEIYELMRSLASRGAAIAVFSSDYEEIKLLATRALVIRRGRVAGELEGDQLTEDNLLSLSLGAE